MDEYLAARRDIREKSVRVVKDFLQQVKENRFPEFTWPPEPDCPALQHGFFDGLSELEETRPDAIRFLKQIRQSWGYDFDVNTPRDLLPSFFPILLGCEYAVTVARISLKKSTECVLNSINAVARAEGNVKSFELVRINKAVVCNSFLYLLTLTIKDVEADVEKTIRATVNMPRPSTDPLVVECKLLQNSIAFQHLIYHIPHIHAGSKRNRGEGSESLSRSEEEMVKKFLSEVQENKFSDEIPTPQPHCPTYKFIHRYILKDLEMMKEDPGTAKEFLYEVSENWGHDVYCMPPRVCPFVCHEGSRVEFYVDFLKKTTACVIDTINIEAKEVGQTFVLVSVNNVVGTGTNHVLLTLTIKIYARIIVIGKKKIQGHVFMGEEGHELLSCSLISSLPT